MVKYIDKSAVVAEIERRKANIKEYCVREGHDRRFDVIPEQLAQILSFLDTIETKEVDEEYNGKAMLHVLEKGVKQGKRELVDKACEWLDDNLHHYWGSISADPHNFLFDFRKAMEDEYVLE